MPREILRKTLTTEHWKSWWMPKYYKLYETELRAGGRYFGCTENFDGKNFCTKGEILEIVPNEKIVMTDSFTDIGSIITPADYYELKNEWPPDMLVTVTFDDLDGKTKLTLKHSGLSGYRCSNMKKDWEIFFHELDDEIKKEKKGEKLFA